MPCEANKMRLRLRCFVVSEETTLGLRWAPALSFIGLKRFNLDKVSQARPDPATPRPVSDHPGAQPHDKLYYKDPISNLQFRAENYLS